MYRIKDPGKSLHFYREVHFVERDGNGFSLYFLAYDHSNGQESAEHKKFYRARREGVLELTHNHGTESQEGEIYHAGNGGGNPRGGFGHIAIVVDDVQAACDRFDEYKVPFQKRLNTEGNVNRVAFIKDPDGYWVEIFEDPRSTTVQSVSNGNPIGLTDVSKYKYNHTMYRVKDAEKTLAFYQDILGMELVDKMGGNDYTNYFLAYGKSEDTSAEEKKTGIFQREGVLQLTHKHGTEQDAEFKYHVGNNVDEGIRGGFGHIAIVVDDVQKACDRFDELGVTFQKRLTDGRMKNIAFILDPDGYWVEIVPNALRT
ncbi:lactoylglutathione lyase [Schizopora paradoxa]|uniref:lactoylglutathione lyase n=1 Tax=Schizopora paradoxa TaxID=27342 RepID=A0A0H2RTN8_9AGAM|nr:lactoylglutathione lyase [Schizopora paradoxa]